MRAPILLAIALAAASVSPVSGAAQRRARIGPTVSTISIEDAAGAGQSFSSFGGAAALLTGDDSEVGLAVSRYGDLSSTNCVRELTFYGLESNYYPVGSAGAVAPYAATTIGLARVRDEDIELLGCGLGGAPPEPTSELGLGFGLGVRVNIGGQFAGLIEGRFFQVPNSAIQALEGRANVSFAFGSPRRSELLNGTLGPAAGFLIPVSGPFEARAPSLGVRFRRDTKKSASLGLQIDYAPLRVTENCSADCEPYAILFAPAYEPSLHRTWGRLYVGLGLLLAGFPSEGADRGIAQGAHGGLGADILTGPSLMTNVSARLLWLQRSNGDNAFLIQIGASLSPRLVRPAGIESR
ncbi:MAG: hypothetical protein ACREMN_10495 [Gemmatimonadales bacterium]